MGRRNSRPGDPVASPEGGRGGSEARGRERKARNGVVLLLLPSTIYLKHGSRPKSDFAGFKLPPISGQQVTRVMEYK